MNARILYQPASQVENAGDQLINLATLNAIRTYGDIVIDDLHAPDWFLDAIGTRKDRRFSEFSKRHFYLGLAGLLVKQKLSGNRLRHYLVLSPGHSSRKGLADARVAFVWYAKLLLLRILGCKVVRAGFSIGPFDRVNAWVESFGSRGFNFYGVRDRKSLALARRFGFSNPRYFPDLAWSYLPFQPSSCASKNGPVVLSFRSNAYGLEHDSGYLRPIRKRLAQLLTSPALIGRDVVVAYQAQSDRDASQELFEDLRTTHVAVALREERLSIGEATRLYSGAYCVISNRLHVLLLAAQSGTLPIPLADMQDNIKITSILSDNGLADIIVNLRESERTSMARIDSILHKRADILQRLRRAREENAERIEHGFAEVFRPD